MCRSARVPKRLRSVISDSDSFLQPEQRRLYRDIPLLIAFYVVHDGVYAPRNFVLARDLVSRESKIFEVFRYASQLIRPKTLRWRTRASGPLSHSSEREDSPKADLRR